MPSDSEHLAVAERNQELINHLLPDIKRFGEWITIVAFYRALHIVEAVFFCDHRDKHGRNHETREDMLKRTPRYQQIYKHYRTLWAASTVARYLEDHSASKTYRSFSEYMSPADVQGLILNHYLKQVEKSAARFLPAPATPVSGDATPGQSGAAAT
jgi:hypothetical protein